MSKARDLADSVSTGGILEDGAVSVSEISDLTVTAAELNNVAGVNSDVQTQLDLKAPLASPTFTGTATLPTAAVTTLTVGGSDVTSNVTGLGTASQLDVGTGANNIVQLNGSGQLPAVDGSNLTGLSSAGNLFSALADGTVTDGDVLILRSDGDVSKVAVEDTDYAFNSSNTAVNANNTSATHIERWKIAVDKSDKTKFCIVGQDNANQGFIRAGSVSNGVVTLGNSTTFTNDFFEGDVCHIQGDYWAIAFRGGNEYGKLINWNSSTNSLGTTYTYTTNSTYRVSCDSPKNGGTDDDRVIVVWMDNNAGNRGEALVAAHGGAGGFNNTGTQYVFSGDDINGQTDVFFDHVNGGSQGIVTYRSNTDNLNYVVPFKFYSGTLTFGSNVSIGINAKNAGLGLRNNAIAYNENQSGVFVVALQNNTGDTIDVVPFTFTEGGANTLPSNITKGTAFTGPAAGGETACDVFLSSNSSNIGGIIFYNNTDNKVQVTDFSLSSNVATEGTTTDISTGGNDNDRWKSVAAEDAGNNFEFYGAYTADGNDPLVESFNLSRTVSATNLSVSPFVGVAQNSATTGQTVSVMTKGGVDDAQTGLTAGTTYYIQDNGSLETSAGSVSKVAGTALSSTTLLIGD
jgi:hypothetical protein